VSPALTVVTMAKSGRPVAIAASARFPADLPALTE
jgi:hypothetical protein